MAPAVSDQVPLAKLDHPASADEPVQIEDDIAGVGAPGAPGSRLPSGLEKASSCVRPGMHLRSPSVASGAALAVGRVKGDVVCFSGSSNTEEFGKAPQQKRIVLIDQYPTDSVVRQKEERKTLEDKLAEEGLTHQEIKISREKRNFNQEEHFENCGSDLDSIEVLFLFINAIAIDLSLDVAIACSYIDGSAFCSDSTQGIVMKLRKC